MKQTGLGSSECYKRNAERCQFTENDKARCEKPVALTVKEHDQDKYYSSKACSRKAVPTCVTGTAVSEPESSAALRDTYLQKRGASFATWTDLSPQKGLARLGGEIRRGPSFSHRLGPLVQSSESPLATSGGRFDSSAWQPSRWE